MAYPYVQTLAALAGAATLAGCVGSNADANVVILHNSAQGAECIASGEAEGGFNSSGIFDLGTGFDIDPDARSGYVFTPVIQNFATDTGENESLRIAFIRGARIDIHFSTADREEALAGIDGLTRFEVPLSGSIDPGGGTVGLIFEIVPAELIPMLTADDLLLVDVRIHGEMGGGSFESAVFRYPIEVCDGCTALNLGSCSNFAMDFTGVGNANGCNIFQDSAVECCLSPGGLPVCPAVGTMPDPA